MDLPINTMAEGRILVPWEHRKYPNLTTGKLYRLSTLVRAAHICQTESLISSADDTAQIGEAKVTSGRLSGAHANQGLLRAISLVLVVPRPHLRPG